MTHHGMEVLLPSSVIRTPALTDMTGRIVRTTDMPGAVVCAATLFCVPWRIVRSAYAEGAVRYSAGADATAAVARASVAMA